MSSQSNSQSMALVPITGTQGQIALQSTALSDVRELLTPDQKREARQRALQVPLADSRAIMDFGQEVSMSEIARKINASTKVGEMRGTPIEQLLIELGLVKKQLDPMQIIRPPVAARVQALLRVTDVMKAYAQNWDNMQARLNDLELKLQRQKEEEGRAIYNQDQLRQDAYNLYERYTVLEAAAKYLLQRLINEYDQRKAALREGDLLGTQQLADLGDFIGMLDRRAFDLHYARARAIEVGQKITIIKKADQELYSMLGSELATSLPLFRIEVASFISALRSKRILDELNAYREAEAKHSAALGQAMEDLAVGVAQASTLSGNRVAQLVASYQHIGGTIDKVFTAYQKDVEARRQLEPQLDKIMIDLQRKVAQYDPKALLRPPTDVEDRLTLPVK